LSCLREVSTHGSSGTAMRVGRPTLMVQHTKKKPLILHGILYYCKILVSTYVLVHSQRSRKMAKESSLYYLWSIFIVTRFRLFSTNIVYKCMLKCDFISCSFFLFVCFFTREFFTCVRMTSLSLCHFAQQISYC